MYNHTNPSFFYNYNKKQLKQGEKLVISQELREVMDRIERLEPKWKNNSYEGTSSICFNKQAVVGRIECQIRVKSTGFDSNYQGGKDGDEGYSDEASIEVVVWPPKSDHVNIFKGAYYGTKYVIVVEKSFWNGSYKGQKMRLIQNPSEEYQYLKAYRETVSMAISDRTKKEREQTEQDCKKIFFGK